VQHGKPLEDVLLFPSQGLWLLQVLVLFSDLSLSIFTHPPGLGGHITDYLCLMSKVLDNDLKPAYRVCIGCKLCNKTYPSASSKV
jgi:hypothetical protein